MSCSQVFLNTIYDATHSLILFVPKVSERLGAAGWERGGGASNCGVRGGGPVPCTGPPPSPPEVRGQGGRGSAALCQICPQLLLSGQYYVARTYYSLQRCEGKGAERARLCVKYAPSCSCQVSIMYRPASFPSRGVRATVRGSAAMCQIHPQLLLSGQYYVHCTGPPPSPPEVWEQGGRGSAALCQIGPQLLLSG